MSGSEIIALAAVIVSGIGVVAGLGFNFWNQRQERSHALDRLKLEHEEKYRSDLYAKRLEIHQEAYRWLMQLITPVGWVQNPKTSTTDTKATLRQEATAARAWWDGHCLYLDDLSRSAVVHFFDLASALGQDDPLPDEFDPEMAYLNALRRVQEGIGKKHLDVPEPRRNDA